MKKLENLIIVQKGNIVNYKKKDKMLKIKWKKIMQLWENVYISINQNIQKK